MIEELSRCAAGRVLASISDDALVSLSRVVGQDINIYLGPRLLATSERDLRVGLLPRARRPTCTGPSCSSACPRSSPRTRRAASASWSPGPVRASRRTRC